MRERDRARAVKKPVEYVHSLRTAQNNELGARLTSGRMGKGTGKEMWAVRVSLTLVSVFLRNLVCVCVF